jgi:hypothetical protein
MLGKGVAQERQGSSLRLPMTGGKTGWSGTFVAGMNAHAHSSNYS